MTYIPRSRKERAFLRWDQQPEDHKDSGCKLSGSGATTRPLLPADQRQTPLTGRPCVGPSAGFLLSDQPKPASLIRTLLLRAGVEPNPGPPRRPQTLKSPCTVCTETWAGGTTVWCHCCGTWIHQRCSGLRTVAEWHRDYVCPRCPPVAPFSAPTPSQATTQTVDPPTPTTPPHPTKRDPITPPNPRPRQPKAEPLTFLQLNCNGIRNKTTELSRFFRTRKIKVAALQETKLTAKGKDPVFEDYTIVRKDRGSGAAGGLMFLVHHTIPFTPVDENTPPGEPLEHQSIQIPLLNEVLTIRNVFTPPPPAVAAPRTSPPRWPLSSRLDAPWYWATSTHTSPFGARPFRTRSERP